jgi:hypothetical protein
MVDCTGPLATRAMGLSVTQRLLMGDAGVVLVRNSRQRTPPSSTPTSASSKYAEILHAIEPFPNAATIAPAVTRTAVAPSRRIARKVTRWSAGKAEPPALNDHPIDSRPEHMRYVNSRLRKDISQL